MDTHTRHKRKSKTVTQITDNEYLIEGEVDYIRFGCEVNPIIVYADIDEGPYLHVGKDFFGKGIIKDIQNIDTFRDGSFIIKITLRNNDGKTN